MKTGMKKMTLVADCNNKAEMINRAIGHLAMQCDIYENNWCGYWDGMQWSSRFVFINPSDAKKNNEIILKEFGVRFSEV